MSLLLEGYTIINRKTGYSVHLDVDRDKKLLIICGKCKEEFYPSEVHEWIIKCPACGNQSSNFQFRAALRRYNPKLDWAYERAVMATYRQFKRQR